MATATRLPVTTAPRDERVYHPLDQLRGVIRRYVIIEGILSALIFLALWLTVAFILDFGMFKAFTWDWVQDGPRWIRVIALVVALVLLAGIVVFRIIRRLTTEFSYPSLALVLERRFPKVLGDRLITAVELADVEKAAAYGYSADMIRQTIGEARERVGKVPVNDVFNWRRLWMMGLIAIGIPLVIAAIGLACYSISTKSFSPVRAGWKLYHVSAILGERNVLLMNTPWPRRALLELKSIDERGNRVDIPEGGIRVARDGAPPRISVKSYRWIIADHTKPDGWRPLMWSDVKESLVGMPVPSVPYQCMKYPDEPSTRLALGGVAGAGAMLTTTNFPDENPTLPVDASEWTVDSLYERARDSAVVRAKLSEKMGTDAYQSLQSVFDHLEAMADNPYYDRTLRRLEKPDVVAFSYTGVKTAGSGTLNPEGNSEYVGDISGLKEDVQFVIKAEDYRTRQRGIILIPPPTLNKLAHVSYQPAYLHHAPPLVPSTDPNRPGELVPGGYSELRGLRQQMLEERLSLTGDRSLTIVPSGTEVVLTGITDLPIVKASVRPKIGKVPGAKPGSAELVPLTLSDENTFSIEFRGEYRITSSVELDLVFENADKVKSERQVVIQVTEDQAPSVEVAPEFLRRVGQVYYVTPRAKIPFNRDSVIRDENGLSKVEYIVKYHRELSELATSQSSIFRPYDGRPEERNASFGLGRFSGAERQMKRETKDHLLSLLSQPVKGEKAELVKRLPLGTDILAVATRRPNGSLESFRWSMDGDYFDVKALNLEAPPGDVQPRYRINLNIQATDTNYDREAGPKTSVNSEPIQLLVVSSGDLLVEIGREQEVLGGKLDEALVRLAAAKSKYAFVNSKHFTRQLDEIDAVRVRSKDAGQDVAKAREIVQAVLREYRKLERECVVNQLEEKTIADYGKLANCLDRVQSDNPLKVQSVSADEDDLVRAGLTTQGGLIPPATFPTTEELIAKAQAVLDENRYADPAVVTDADIAINTLEREVIRIRNLTGEAQSKDRLKKFLGKIIEEQARVRSDIELVKAKLDIELTDPNPAIGGAGPIFLAKGETKKIKHAINWRQYKEDTLPITVTSNNATAVIAPGELKLDYEKNQFDFSYDLRAGTTEGEYTVTVTPKAGQKVEIKVVVK